MAKRSKAKPPVEEAPKPEEAEENLEQGGEGEGEDTEGEGDENDPETDGDSDPEDGEGEGEDDPAPAKPQAPAILPSRKKAARAKLVLKEGDQVPVEVMHRMNVQGMTLAEALEDYNNKLEQGG